MSIGDMFANNGFYVFFIYFVMLSPQIVLSVITSWRIFVKTGEKGWKALIPFYSKYVLFKQVWDKNVYWFVLVFDLLFCFTFRMLIHPANETEQLVWGILSALLYIVLFVFTVIREMHLSSAFNHNNKFALGLIFLNPVFTCILAFGKAQYIGIRPIRNRKQQNRY